MTESYRIDISDEIEQELKGIEDEVVEEYIIEALNQLASEEKELENQRDELRSRMGLSPASNPEEEVESLSQSNRQEQLRMFLRGDRKDGIEKS